MYSICQSSSLSDCKLVDSFIFKAAVVFAIVVQPMAVLDNTLVHSKFQSTVSEFMSFDVM